MENVRSKDKVHYKRNYLGIGTLLISIYVLGWANKDLRLFELSPRDF